MKRLISIVLSMLIVIGTATIVNASEPSAWAKTEVDSAIEAGLVPEDLQQNYASPITRGQIADMVMILLEKSTGKTIDTILSEQGIKIDYSVYTDTDDINLLSANALGIMNETSEDKLSPDSSLKRSEITKIISRTARLLGYETQNTMSYRSFNDVRYSGKNSWYELELGWPISYGIIKGVGNSLFAPESDLTIEQAILVMFRTYIVFTRDESVEGISELLDLINMTAGEIRLKYGVLELVYLDEGLPVYSVDGLPGVLVAFSHNSQIDPLADYMLPVYVSVYPDYGKSVNGLALYDRVEEKNVDLPWTFGGFDMLYGNATSFYLDGDDYRLLYKLYSEEYDEPGYGADDSEWDAWNQKFLSAPYGMISAIRISSKDSARDYYRETISVLYLLHMTVGEMRERLGEPKLEYSEPATGTSVFSFTAFQDAMAQFACDANEPLADEMLPSAVIVTTEDFDPYYIRLNQKIGSYPPNMPWSSVSYNAAEDVLYLVADESLLNGAHIYTYTIDAHGISHPDETAPAEEWDSWNLQYLSAPYGTVIGIRISRIENISDK
jgi:hypothetical protein